MLFKSVIGKLWLTIVFLFTIVLVLLMVLLLQFYHNYYLDEVKTNLKETNENLVKVFKEHGLSKVTINFAYESNVEDIDFIVLLENGNLLGSSKNIDEEMAKEYIKNASRLVNPIEQNKSVFETIHLPKVFGWDDKTQGIIFGTPVKLNGLNGAIYSYQSLALIDQSVKTITSYVFVAIGIGILLTTILAFFLSTKVTRPLREMRDMSLEISKGNFDQEIPIQSNDEIGDLTVTFNEMARQLKMSITGLNQEKEHLASILKSMNGGVVTLGANGEILLTNSPADTFIRYCNFEKTKSLQLANHTQVPELLLNLFKKVKETENAQFIDVSFQGHDWLITMSPLYHLDTIRGAVAIIRETTEEKQLDKLRKDFIANVSHELRTPMVMLQGYSEAIIDDIAESQEEKREMARIIHDESLRIGRLVNDFLDLARMEAGFNQFDKQAVEIKPYLEKIAYKFHGLANEKKITLSVVVESDHIVAHFDPDRIEQVFTNLVDNAIRHTNEGGTVEIIHESTQKGNNFHVKDSGAGISEEDLPYVFERFYKVDKARTRGKTGTGLGLSIAKNIVVGHNGIITVSSKLGLWTRFSFFIPEDV
ncbi:MAG: cell wall metabolism sensor histidine kinase WalK [Bacillales bacterium]|jgi:two-component system sensor histidine kinase ResE|nr:cell wall metabolism sensor histidine kinase WalK [Bacillales bacterium]